MKDPRSRVYHLSIEDAHMQKVVRRSAPCFSAFVLIIGAGLASAQAPDPFAGTWKLNLTKSKYVTAAPKSTTITFAPAAKGYAVTIDAIGPDGQPQKWGYTSSFDGSENPVSGNPGVDTVVARTRNGTVEYLKAGKVVATTASVMSDDGRTLTVTVKFADPQGNELTNVSVYDRQ
jgi:hypothetical protein